MRVAWSRPSRRHAALVTTVTAVGSVTLGALHAGAALAQSPPQAVSPPKAQAWIDVATFSGMGMPGMGGMPGMAGGGGEANPMAMIGSLLGGGGAPGGARNNFGQTRSMQSGRWVDVTLRGPAALAEARQQVPPGFLSPALQLVSPQQPPARPVPEREADDVVLEPEVQKPRGRMLLYWGCGAAVRQGQPRVLDFATMSTADLGRFFVSRGATGRGAHSTPGRPVWPNPSDARMVLAGASLVGEHQFSGSGVPENFRFAIPAAQDLMPALALQQKATGEATELSWNAIGSARAYFASAMGAGAGGREEMVLWTSSEEADTGFGLGDYQTNAAIDRWLREKILLAPATTSCTVPAGIFAGQGAMIRLVAYGSELNLAYPPRPTDPKVRWDPDWAVKVRVKSIAQGLLGMSEMPGMPGAEAPAAEAPEEKKPSSTLDRLRGILGR